MPHRPQQSQRRPERWSRHEHASSASHGRVRPLCHGPVDAPLGFELDDLSGASQRRVLIVDDDAFARETLGRLLEGDGYNVATAANGGEALRHLQREPRPGLIVLDLMMPRVDGFAFAKEQQRHPELAGIPVIVVSASDCQRTLAVSAMVARFEKPVDVAELLRTINQHLPLE